MNSVNLADAKARLDELVDQAESGEVIQIMRRGKPVAQIAAIAEKFEPLGLELMRKLRASLPFDDEPAGKFVRRMRDEGIGLCTLDQGMYGAAVALGIRAATPLTAE